MGIRTTRAALVLALIFGARPASAEKPGDSGRYTPVYDPSRQGLRAFHNALDGLERPGKGPGKGTVRGKVRVVFFGASHIAGDGITGYIRVKLKERYGDGGAGLVVPAAPWTRFNRHDLELGPSSGWTSYWVKRGRKREDGLYGLAGVSFVSGDPSAVARLAVRAPTPSEGAPGEKARVVEVYYWGQPRGGTLRLFADGKELLPPLSTRAEVEGPGERAFRVEEDPLRLELRPRGDGETLLFGVSIERDGPGVVVDSLGINGARAADQLKWNDALFEALLVHRDPALVVLAYGTNASGDRDDPLERYGARLDRVVARVRRAVPRASCLLVGPSDWPMRAEDGRGFEPRRRQDGIIAEQKRAAREHGCAFWDFREAMGGPLSMLRWRSASPTLALKDRVHLTHAGYQKIGALLLEALMAGSSPRLRSRRR